MNLSQTSRRVQFALSFIIIIRVFIDLHCTINFLYIYIYIEYYKCKF